MTACKVLTPSAVDESSVYSPPRRQYHQITQDYNESLKALWTYMKPAAVPCFNLDMLEELHHNVKQIEQNNGMIFHDGAWRPINYCIFASRSPKVFNLGGDLALFIELIKNRDKGALMHYGRLCIEGLYTRINGKKNMLML